MFVLIQVLDVCGRCQGMLPKALKHLASKQGTDITTWLSCVSFEVASLSTISCSLEWPANNLLSQVTTMPGLCDVASLDGPRP